jgi:ribosomal protein S27AE
LVCPWCGDLHGDGTEIVPRLLVVVDEAGDALVLGALADEWCCSRCGYEWDEFVGELA